MTRIIQGKVAYKLVKNNRPNCRTHFYKLTIPAEMGDQVPDDTYFVPEFVEEGILLRRVTSSATKEERIKWLKKPTSSAFKNSLEEEAESLAEKNPELRELIEEQEKDKRFPAFKPWEVSIFKPIHGTDGLTILDTLEG